MDSVRPLRALSSPSASAFESSASPALYVDDIPCQVFRGSPEDVPEELELLGVNNLLDGANLSGWGEDFCVVGVQSTRRRKFAWCPSSRWKSVVKRLSISNP